MRNPWKIIYVVKLPCFSCKLEWILVGSHWYSTFSAIPESHAACVDKPLPIEYQPVGASTQTEIAAIVLQTSIYYLELTVTPILQNYYNQAYDYVEQGCLDGEPLLPLKWWLEAQHDKPCGRWKVFEMAPKRIHLFHLEKLRVEAHEETMNTLTRIKFPEKSRFLTCAGIHWMGGNAVSWLKLMLRVSKRGHVHARQNGNTWNWKYLKNEMRKCPKNNANLWRPSERASEWAAREMRRESSVVLMRLVFYYM